MKKQSIFGAALLAASIFAVMPAAHADDDDAGAAVLGFALGTALSAGAPVYAAPAAPVIVVPRRRYYYYGPPPVYAYPRHYRYRDYDYRDHHHWHRRWHRPRHWHHHRGWDDD